MQTVEAIESGSRETQPTWKNVAVPGFSTVTFHYFNEWLYADAIDVSSWETLIDLYLFAEQYFIPKFQDRIVNRMIQQSYHGAMKSPSLALISANWGKLVNRLPARDLLVKTYADYGDTVEAINQQNLVTAPEQFVAGLAQTLYERSRGATNGYYMLWTRKCNWHVHSKEENCLLSEEDKVFEKEFFGLETTSATADDCILWSLLTLLCFVKNVVNVLKPNGLRKLAVTFWKCANGIACILMIF